MGFNVLLGYYILAIVICKFTKVKSLDTLQGIQIVAAAFEDDVTGANSQLENTADLRQVEGNVSYAMDLWILLTQKLKFKTKFIQSPASRDEITDDSLRALVTSGAAQVVMSPTQYNDKIKDLVFTQQSETTRYKLFIQTPTSVTSYTGLIDVFTWSTWLTVLCTVIVIALVMIFVTRLGEKEKISAYCDLIHDNGSLAIIILGNFCYQGAAGIASGLAGRITLLTSLLCGSLVYVSFGVYLLTQLNAVQFQAPFESLQEMSFRTSHKLLLRNDSVLLGEIERVRNDSSHGLYPMWRRLLPGKKITDNVYNDGVRAVRRMCRENLALLDSEERITAKVMRRAGCSATPLRPTYFRSHLGILLSPNNSFNELFSRTLIVMREVGLTHKWKTHWDSINGLKEQVATPPDGPTPVSINGLVPILVIYCSGVLLSLMIFVLEVCHSKWKSARAVRFTRVVLPSRVVFRRERVMFTQEV